MQIWERICRICAAMWQNFTMRMSLNIDNFACIVGKVPWPTVVSCSPMIRTISSLKVEQEKSMYRILDAVMSDKLDALPELCHIAQEFPAHFTENDCYQDILWSQLYERLAIRLICRAQQTFVFSLKKCFGWRFGSSSRTILFWLFPPIFRQFQRYCCRTDISIRMNSLMCEGLLSTSPWRFS